MMKKLIIRSTEILKFKNQEKYRSGTNKTIKVSIFSFFKSAELL
jgi:hypothetical protein